MATEGEIIVIGVPFDTPALEGRLQLHASMRPRRRWFRNGWAFEGWVCMPTDHMVGTWRRPQSYVLRFAGWLRTEREAKAAVDQLLVSVRGVEAGGALVLPRGMWAA